MECEPTGLSNLYLEPGLRRYAHSHVRDTDLSVLEHLVSITHQLYSNPDFFYAPVRSYPLALSLHLASSAPPLLLELLSISLLHALKNRILL